MLNKKNLSYFAWLTSILLWVGRKATEPITCTSDASLKDIMAIVLKQHVHRVWIIDEQKKPIGVVTLTDIIHAITKFVSGDQEIKSM